ncbi:succinate dehydrogenase, cytochrome b556 subunit [Altererythrobacter lutimaris]|uniref:Succinate dehydrogenase cytochrome b556 subunit n=1 Tax=Altererythrobacter lutimaris TaxID=2743979 RepID=A0A850H7W6_9SPHN|nr:succinate dehydrogenase, cytochrome b556 subunit [Altererythrobacter lutimaris]NVE93869.1 succinate dehydrogenase, cytochrome b556 subunit [Altererythrobacter lutimaris]
MGNRPLSPHLQIWKWGPHMLVSILHRVTGDGMALVGLFVLVWWLGAIASGPTYYSFFTDIMTSPVGYIVMVGLSWAFFTHLMSGLRHFVLDIGAGYELDTNRAWSIASPLIAIALTAGFWALILNK